MIESATPQAAITDITGSSPTEEASAGPSPAVGGRSGVAALAVRTRSRISRLTPADAAEIATYLAVVVYVLWPALGHLTTRIVGTNDAHFYAWEGWRVGELLKHGHLLTWRVPDVMWPFGFDFSMTDGLLPLYATAVWNLVAGPYLAYNLSLATAIVLNIAAARYLAIRLGADRTTRTLVAVAYATAPCLVLRFTGHLSLIYAFAVPLLLAEAVRVVRDGEPLRVARVAAFLFIAFLCSIYYLVFGAIAFAVVLLVGNVRRPAELRTTALRLCAALGMALVLMSPLLLKRLAFDSAETAHGRPPASLQEAQLYSADVLGVFTQHDQALIPIPGESAISSRLSPPTNTVEHTVFPGWLLIMGLLGSFVVRDRLRWPILAAAGVTWIMALGPTLLVDGRAVFQRSDGSGVFFMPYSPLLGLPGLRSMRAPNRASMTLIALMAAATAILLVHVIGRFRPGWQRTTATYGLALLVGSNLVWWGPGATSRATTPAIDSALRTVAQRARPGNTTLFIPMDCLGEEGWRQEMQILLHTPIVGCHGQYGVIPFFSGLGSYARSDAMASLRCRENILGPVWLPDRHIEFSEQGDLPTLRREFGVRFVVVDRSALRAPNCGGVASAARQLEGTQILGTSRRWIIIDTTPPA